MPINECGTSFLKKKKQAIIPTWLLRNQSASRATLEIINYYVNRLIVTAVSCGKKDRWKAINKESVGEKSSEYCECFLRDS